MAIFEVESWRIREGKEEEHTAAMRVYFAWIKEHRELFHEWRSVRYFEKHIAGPNTGQFFIMWEYDNIASFEAYKTRRRGYPGPFAPYRQIDPYYMDVFDHSTMEVEIWNDQERENWLV